MSIDLLPCPFCGGTSVGIIDARFQVGRDWITKYSVRHACNPTSATDGIFCQTTWFPTKEAAAELWNTRQVLK